MNTNNEKLDNLSIAFTLSTIITLLFNTILAWVKDSYKPLEHFMATIGGHHWITHGIFDVLLFILLGILFYRMNSLEKFKDDRLVKIVIVSAFVSSFGLIGWFFFL
ncbi:hypothetical protein [Sulfuricurvum sp.]|uniref:hypothetical protein n=1 Tax=Sulfuricurvum sp. TaxID=2025608 RepID=UPI00356234C2